MDEKLSLKLIETNFQNKPAEKEQYYLLLWEAFSSFESFDTHLTEIHKDYNDSIENDIKATIQTSYDWRFFHELGKKEKEL